MSYQETVRNSLGLTAHRGIVERLYVFPGKSWNGTTDFRRCSA
jgi:hypothetical protein